MFVGQKFVGNSILRNIVLVPTIPKTDHSKSWLFCPDFIWFLTLLRPFVLISKWLGFQISDPIRNPDNFKPNLFQPFEIQASLDFRSPLYSHFHCRTSGDLKTWHSITEFIWIPKFVCPKLRFSFHLNTELGFRLFGEKCCLKRSNTSLVLRSWPKYWTFWSWVCLFPYLDPYYTFNESILPSKFFDTDIS